jgi:hypothetical protein
MSKKDRRSHDQKRKARLAKKARRAHTHASPLAYRGNKYKTDAYLPLVFRTELAIHEADVISRRQITDADVTAALEELIIELRRETPPDAPGEADQAPGGGRDLIMWNIRQHWQILEEEEAGRWGKESRVGVLRTLLGSIETWSAPGAQSRGYLHFLEGFLKKTGASVREVPAEGEFLPEDEEDELLEVGRDWVFDHEPGAADEFRRLAEERILVGDAESVVDATQQLIGEGGSNDPETMRELSALSLLAQRRMLPEKG